MRQSGWDNRTFRLGEDRLVRLPSAARYSDQVTKEQKWLPKLAPYLSCLIPKPLALGFPSLDYPWNWSVYQWIEGETADILQDHALKPLASDLAKFLNELHNIDTLEGPLAGSHNFYRGASPLVYDLETRSAITQLKDQIPVDAVTQIWERAIHGPQWNGHPLWIHGDLSVGNILVKEDRLVAVIDFGGLGVGDPACDLVIAWTLLTLESRQIFRAHLDLDSDTWARARGWGLWKALITLAFIENPKSLKALKMKQVIHRILSDHDQDRFS